MLLDVIVPGPWWNEFTYNYNYNFNNLNLKSGLRVRVPFGKHNGKRAGFICAENLNSNNNFEIKEIIELIDDEPVLKFGLWELAQWLGKTYLCGTGMALQTILPGQILDGERLPLCSSCRPCKGRWRDSDGGVLTPEEFSQSANLNFNNNKIFREQNFFDPRDNTRFNFYLDMLRREHNNLILFPEAELAKKFFNNLPKDVKDLSILWPSVGGQKLWDAWREIYSGNFKNVIAPPGGVFAPFDFDSIIVEDEASEGYLSRKTPIFSARSVAGKRALDLQSELILAGRMPSSKTFMRLIKKQAGDFHPSDLFEVTSPYSGGKIIESANSCPPCKGGCPTGRGVSFLKLKRENINLQDHESILNLNSENLSGRENLNKNLTRDNINSQGRENILNLNSDSDLPKNFMSSNITSAGREQLNKNLNSESSSKRENILNLNKINFSLMPDKNNLIFVDINKSLKVEERGVEGKLPVTFSMLERTRQELENGRHVAWLLDRKGGAAEVFCIKCGKAIKCDKCGSIMRSEHDGQILKCPRCNNKLEMLTKCPECGGEVLSGKRPGLEVLFNAAEILIKNYKIILHDANKKFNLKNINSPSLIIGTRGALTLCGDLDIGLIAWLDLDAELRRSDYNARFRVFNMLWQSCWRGVNFQNLNLNSQNFTQDLDSQGLTQASQELNLSSQDMTQDLKQNLTQEQTQDLNLQGATQELNAQNFTQDLDSQGLTQGSQELNLNSQDLKQAQARKVLIQTRRENFKFALNNLNWQKFWQAELETRRDLDLPPFGVLIKVSCKNKIKREELINKLDEAGIFAMDLSDDLDDKDNKKSDGALLISAQSVRSVYKIFEPYFNVFNLKYYNSLRDIVIYAE